MSESLSSREQAFSELFHATAEKYAQVRQRNPELIGAPGCKFLASIGYTTDEFFDFIDDLVGISGDSFAWYERAANRGSITAQGSLAYLYANGLGVAQDYGKAALWYRKAAEQGSSTAQEGLGYLYANGLGVAQDDAQAVEWHRRAAESGSAYSQFALGLHYQHGQGVAQDLAQARDWFQKSAAQGNPEAQQELAKIESSR